ncbi:MAG: hypothetical protein H0T17_03520 [Propionibacteriales bacterium]|nr:hypothetical protein [Propionibacteriales bacterium]
MTFKVRFTAVAEQLVASASALSRAPDDRVHIVVGAASHWLRFSVPQLLQRQTTSM